MKWLINPFERIAGWQALALGVAVMALTAVVGQMNHVAFDGVLDFKGGATFSLSASFVMQSVVYLVAFLMILLAGLCFSKSKIRVIDVAGTIALSCAPMLLPAILCFLPVVPKSILDTSRMLIFGIICLPFIIWMIALMYNAYTVSCNLRGTRAVISFIGALVMAEVISKVIFILLISYTSLFNLAAFTSDDKSIGISEVKTYQVEDKDLDKYLGIYSSKQIPLKLTITKTEGKLIGQGTGQPSFPLEAVGKDTFKFEQAALIMEFNPIDKTMVLKQHGGVFNFEREDL